jgi:acetyl esterase/lipase
VVERVRCKRASGSITAKHATKTILFISINLLTLGHSTRRTEVIFNAAAAAGFGYTSASRPAFVAPIYAAASMKNAPVPSDAPPLFLAAATDDQLNLAPDSIQLYNQWTAAHKSAELHMYAKGGHGFGMRQQGIPTDHWVECFGEWLDARGLLKK